MPKKKKKPNKSDFIRSQPAELSAAGVVAKAKEAGVVVTTGLVYRVRGTLKAKAAKAHKGAPAKAEAPAAAHAAHSGAKMSASDFIRSMPATMKAKQVAAKGASQGYSFKSALVYTVRATQHKKAGKAAKHETAAKPAAHTHSAAIATHKSAFRKLMIRIGLDEAETLYAEVHHELKTIEHS